MIVFFANLRKLLLSSNTHWAFLSQAVHSFGNLALTLLILRVDSLESLGLFTLYFMWVLVSKEFFVSVVLAPMSVGIGRQEIPLNTKYMGFIFTNCFVIVVAIAALCTGAAMTLNVALDSQLYFWAIACGISFAVSEVGKRLCLLNGVGVHVLLSESLRWLVALTALYLLVGPIYKVAAVPAFMGLVMGNLITAFCLFVSLRRSFHINTTPYDAEAVWALHTNFIKWSSAFVLVKAMISRMPMLIGASVLGLGTVGVYRAWFQVANALNLPFHALTQVHAATASKIMSSDGLPTMVRYLMQSTVFVGGVVLAVALLLLMLTDTIAIVLGVADFSVNHRALFCSLLVCNLMILLRLPLQTIAEVTSRTKHVFVANAASMMVGLPACFLLIEYSGALGMGLSQLVFALASLLVLAYMRPWHAEFSIKSGSSTVK